MRAEVREREFAGLRWLVVEGEREEAFRALGAAAREDVRAVQEALPEGEGLRTWAAGPAGSARLERLLRASGARHPDQVRELRALAAGAGADFHGLLLANLRGDIGSDDATGCTDLGWRRECSYVAHNEDGAPVLAERLALLTLLIDGDAPVTVQWYPGFLPANTFTATGHGLVWGVDHVQVDAPAPAAGRHFVARALQQAPTLDAAVRFLRAHPAAGGFAYTVGEVDSGRVAVVEAAAGRTAVVEAGRDRPLEWHTNHLRRLTGLDGGGSGAGTRQLGLHEESRARGAVLRALRAPRDEPGADWFVDALTSAPLPDGVHRSAAGRDPLATVCTTVADLAGDRIILRGARGPTAETSLSGYARGRCAPAG